MNTSPVHSSNFTGRLNRFPKTFRSISSTASPAINNGLRFSGDDPLELNDDSLKLKKVKSSDSIKRREIKEKLANIFRKSEVVAAQAHGKRVFAYFDRIKELALNPEKRKEFLEPFSPSLTGIEAANGEFVSNRVLVYFKDKAAKDYCLSYIPEKGFSFSLSKRFIQVALSLKHYTLENNMATDGTVTVSRTEELPPKSKAKLDDKKRCIEQKKYIIHTSHSALEPEEVAVEVQIALKTQTEIDEEQGAAPPKKLAGISRWGTWS